MPDVVGLPPAAVTIEAAIARVRAFARSRNWKKSRLAAEAGLSDTVLRHFNRPEWNPTADTLRRLELIVPSDFVCPHGAHPEGESAESQAKVATQPAAPAAGEPEAAA